ncbi:PhoH family protein [candidate division WOR-3 bacterium]|nr:PhoH family protein [candidate division WOR-3 bacterium]
MFEQSLEIKNIPPIALLGVKDENVVFLEKRLGVRITARGPQLIIRGEKDRVYKSVRLIGELTRVLEDGGNLTTKDIEYYLYAKNGRENIIVLPNKVIKPRTANQARYLEEIEKQMVTIAIGPAGTGKTYLAVASAISALLSREVSRIILARPAVEAGESLGFLPGDYEEKVKPYLRPLYDAIYEMLPQSKIQKYMDTGLIEIAPLAFMRGRDLKDSFIILDEAQNTTHSQMKMFLTRMGEDSKVVITGDITQIDLTPSKTSGLVEIQNILNNIKGVSFVYLTALDVVRNPIVEKIVRAYRKYEERKDK